MTRKEENKSAKLQETEEQRIRREMKFVEEFGQCMENFAVGTKK